MYDVVIIGSGPGGYVASIRAAQLGLKTAVVEKSELGGICLNWGCIPTKALMKSASVIENIKKAREYGISVNDYSINYSDIIKRSRTVAQTMSKGIEYLFKKNNIHVYKGKGKLIDKHQIQILSDNNEEKIIEAKNIIIATGSRPKELPHIKIDNNYIVSYHDALSNNSLPEEIVVVGAGAIGCEFSYFFNVAGSKVTLVEYMTNILPLVDEEISKTLERIFKKNGINIITSSYLKNYKISDNKVIAEIQTPQEVKEVKADKILLSVGVKSNIEDLGLEELNIITEKDKIIVNNHYQTNVENIYAIGDVINTPALAHVASAEGIHCVEYIAGLKPEPINYNAIPSCVYTNPEISSVGLTEKQAIEIGYKIKIGKFPFTASGKAKAVGSYDGLIKIITNAETNEILGVHSIGYNVTEIIAEATLGINNKIKLHNLIKTVHPHPTISEGIMEAAAAAAGEAIHL